ncbi:hypothetical protein BC833DRAFT_592441 [Globomyces pollinis-pini]|nr:hypothetical protein BC833DRAFT_592441 [Globomyces pollinis-pini]
MVGVTLLFCILSPTKSKTNSMDIEDRRCARCKIRFLPCNGLKPCNACIRYGKLTKRPTPECEYVFQDIKQPQLFRETEASEDIVMHPVISVAFDDLIDTNATLESHLLHLASFNDIELVVGSDLSVVLPTQKHSLSRSYQNALCKLALPFSNHPQLFDSPGPHSKETVLKVAKRFKVDSFSEAIEQGHSDVSLHCDNVRALISQTFFQFGFGFGFDELSIYDGWELLVSLFGEHQIKKFPQLLKSNFTSVDDLVNMLIPKDLARFGERELTLHEQLDCYTLWVQLYRIVTVGSLVSAENFYFDDFDFENIYFDIPFKPVLRTRRFLPDLAKYTIWEGTHWAPLYDELREATFQSTTEVQNSGLYFRAHVVVSVLLRKVVRHSRSTTFAQNEDIQANRELHDEILTFIKGLPQSKRFFGSLSDFVYGSTVEIECDIRVLRCSCDSLFVVYLSLLMLSYLHLPLVQNNQPFLFPAFLGGPELFSSRDILFATISALSYVIKRLSEPILPEESLFGTYSYPQAQLEKCMANKSMKIPPPTLVSLPTICLIFAITTASLNAFQYPGADVDQTKALRALVQQQIYPLVESIGDVWPSTKSLSEMMVGFI